MKRKPPTFRGCVSPSECLRRLRKLSQIFRVSDYTDSQNVHYFGLRLEGEVLEWWDLLDQVITKRAR